MCFLNKSSKESAYGKLWSFLDPFLTHIEISGRQSVRSHGPSFRFRASMPDPLRTRALADKKPLRC
jgi:hypothetical protein